MKHLLTREFEPTAKPEDRRFKTLQMRWDRIVAATTNPHLIAVMIFSAIGLLIALHFMSAIGFYYGDSVCTAY